MFLLIGLIEKRFSQMNVGKHITKNVSYVIKYWQNLITETINVRECQT